MPELPEVETIARGVDARVRGDRIVDVWFGTHREPFKTAPSRQAKALQGRSILSVHRTGKHIVVELQTANQSGRKVIPSNLENRPDAQWIVHLGMTGRLLVTTPEAPLAPHTHARLTLASGREMAAQPRCGSCAVQDLFDLRFYRRRQYRPGHGRAARRFR